MDLSAVFGDERSSISPFRLIARRTPSHSRTMRGSPFPGSYLSSSLRGRNGLSRHCHEVTHSLRKSIGIESGRVTYSKIFSRYVAWCTLQLRRSGGYELRRSRSRLKYGCVGRSGPWRRLIGGVDGCRRRMRLGIGACHHTKCRGAFSITTRASGLFETDSRERGTTSAGPRSSGGVGDAGPKRTRGLCAGSNGRIVGSWRCPWE